MTVQSFSGTTGIFLRRAFLGCDFFVANCFGCAMLITNLPFESTFAALRSLGASTDGVSAATGKCVPEADENSEAWSTTGYSTHSVSSLQLRHDRSVKTFRSDSRGNELAGRRASHQENWSSLRIIGVFISRSKKARGTDGEEHQIFAAGVSDPLAGPWWNDDHIQVTDIGRWKIADFHTPLTAEYHVSLDQTVDPVNPGCDAGFDSRAGDGSRRIIR